MKILITGGKGQLGTDLAASFAGAHQVLTMDLPQLDIGDPESVARAVDPLRPDVIINCAAVTAVDACETLRDEAFRVNGDGPGHLARSLVGTGGYLLHISTDYVFDGCKAVPRAYEEEDVPAPLSVYGKSKWEGEKQVMETLENSAVVRTAWLYGASGRNFLKTMLRLALSDPARPIRVVSDQYGSPTWSRSLARQLALLVEKKPIGIFHATSEGYTTWYELAGRFLEQMNVPHQLTPCTTAEYPTPAARPANSILENRNLKRLGLNLMPQWDEGLASFVDRFRGFLLREARTALRQAGHA